MGLCLAVTLTGMMFGMIPLYWWAELSECLTDLSTEAVMVVGASGCRHRLLGQNLVDGDFCFLFVTLTGISDCSWQVVGRRCQ